MVIIRHIIEERINDYLSELITTIFKELISKSTEKIQFGKMIIIGSGGTPKTSVNEYWGDEIPFFSPKDVSGIYTYNTEKSITKLGLDNCNSGYYPKNTVFITARGTVGKIALAAKDMAMNQSCYAISSSVAGHEHFIHQMCLFTVDSIKQKSNGAVFDAINANDIAEELVPFVSEEDIDQFEKLVGPIYEAIWNSGLESQKLSYIRDVLLPKLMSGEINVSKLELDN